MLLRMKRARLEAGLTQREVGERAGIAAQSIGRMEGGRELPWPAARARLSNLYGVPEDELFWDIDEAQRFLRRFNRASERFQNLKPTPADREQTP